MSHTGSADTTTPTPEIPAVLARLAELVAAGKYTAARRAAASLIDHTDPHTLAVIARCAEALQADRDTATGALDELWLAATDHDAAIITACLPAPDYIPDLPTQAPEPAWKGQVRWVAPSRVQTRRGPITTPTAAGDPGIVSSYLAESAEPGPGYTGTERLIGYERDYDRAALPPVQGQPCVVCWLERSRADHQRGDGLCGECHDAGHPGIPAPPAGHTRADAINARCQYIADTDTTGHGGLPTLRAEYRRANSADRAVITEWVAAHRPQQAGTAGLSTVTSGVGP